MYRCMANCEDDQSLTSMDRVQDCLNACRDTFLNPKRQIVEAEVNRLHWMMNRELDLCVDRARYTIDQPEYNPGKTLGRHFVHPLLTKLVHYGKFTG